MTEPPGRLRVAVVGGGVTGLATAWYLRAGISASPPEVTVLEAGERLGGKIRTEELAGVTVEAGPDTFLARVPWATDLCRAVGLGEDLVAPATTKAYVWTGGRLRPLPRGTVLGVPVTVDALVGSGLLSPRGAARAALDLVLPRSRTGSDPTVAEVVGRRMGEEVLDALVDPLVGGINAGRADRLSLRSTARPLAVAADRHRSLVLGLRADRRRAAPTTTGPLFLGVTGGLGLLVDALHGSLGGPGVEVRAGTGVTGLEATDGGRWRLACQPGPDVVADAVVLTVPAFAAARILDRAAPAAAAELGAIRYASVAVASLAYRSDFVRRPLDGSGFLVPRTEGRLVTACTWSTSKWPHLRRHDLVVVRASAGRDGDERALELDDGDLVLRLHAELVEMMGVTAPPVASRVDRWPRSFPQYEPGHEARVGRAEAALVGRPGLFLAGAGYRGLGIAACVQQAEAAAGETTVFLSHHSHHSLRGR